jgi:hypothetical protein
MLVAKTASIDDDSDGVTPAISQHRYERLVSLTLYCASFSLEKRKITHLSLFSAVIFIAKQSLC